MKNRIIYTIGITTIAALIMTACNSSQPALEATPTPAPTAIIATDTSNPPPTPSQPERAQLNPEEAKKALDAFFDSFIKGDYDASEALVWELSKSQQYTDEGYSQSLNKLLADEVSTLKAVQTSLLESGQGYCTFDAAMTIENPDGEFVSNSLYTVVNVDGKALVSADNILSIYEGPGTGDIALEKGIVKSNGIVFDFALNAPMQIGVGENDAILTLVTDVEGKKTENGIEGGGPYTAFAPFLDTKGGERMCILIEGVLGNIKEISISNVKINDKVQDIKIELPQMSFWGGLQNTSPFMVN